VMLMFIGEFLPRPFNSTFPLRGLPHPRLTQRVGADDAVGAQVGEPSQRTRFERVVGAVAIEGTVVVADPDTTRC
jgi:hypothetical protein